jgi:hypothetical protein
VKSGYDTRHFTDLENDVIRYSREGHIMLTDDFNARIGRKDDFIQGDSFRFLPNGDIF